MKNEDREDAKKDEEDVEEDVEEQYLQYFAFAKFSFRKATIRIAKDSKKRRAACLNLFLYLSFKISKHCICPLSVLFNRMHLETALKKFAQRWKFNAISLVLQ